eukprot:Nk52_evm2s259 gene=Nk52_evmTU2s259
MRNDKECVHWDPHSVFKGIKDKPSGKNNALIILNQDIAFSLVAELFDHCGLIVCADGGANRLYDVALKHSEASLNRFVPNFITGDLDSLRMKVANFYSSKGTKILERSSQYEQDFGKSYNIVLEQEEEMKSQFEYIYVLGALDGRFDQTMSNINMLYRYESRKMVLITDISSVFLLKKGENLIQVNRMVEGPTCGLIPVGHKVNSIKTRGLKWDVEDVSMEFGGLVSSSNGFEEPSDFSMPLQEVWVQTSEAIVYTVEHQFAL